MKYNVTFKISHPNNGKFHIVTGTVSIEPSGSFPYGNGKCMVIKWDKKSVPVMGSGNCYDIRYDHNYNEEDEPGYIKTFFEEEYHGSGVIWKASHIKVEKEGA